MKLIKRWQLNHEPLTEADFTWIKRYAHDIDVKQAAIEIDTPAGRFQVAGTRATYIQTITQEQEDMLYLKYGQELILHTQCWVSDDTIYRDEYGTFTSIR